MSQTLTAQPGPVTSPQAAMPARVAPVGANRAQFLWLCALILSFCYELPIYYLTSMDRLNPRLFDLVAVAGVYILLFQNRGLRSPWRNPIFKWWFWLVIWFSVCAAIYAAAWFPWDAAGKYSA